MNDIFPLIGLLFLALFLAAPVILRWRHRQFVRRMAQFDLEYEQAARQAEEARQVREVQQEKNRIAFSDYQSAVEAAQLRLKEIEKTCRSATDRRRHLTDTQRLLKIIKDPATTEKAEEIRRFTRSLIWQGGR